QRELIAVRQVIDKAIAFFSDPLARNGVELIVEVDPRCPKVSVKSSEIVQVLVALLSNSVDALQSEPKRWIRIVEEPERNGLALWVTDAGHMSLDLAERIMDPLFTTKEHGIGLGLSVARGIAEAHGGSLRFKGDRANTTFVLWLPAAP